MSYSRHLDQRLKLQHFRAVDAIEALRTYLDGDEMPA